MKKFTFILFAMVLSGAIFAQQAKIENLVPSKTLDGLKITNSTSGAKVDTDTLFNVDLEGSLTIYGLSNAEGTAWGYWTGHNSGTWLEYAETFTAPIDGQLNGLVFVPAKAYGTGDVTFKVYDDATDVPGTVLATKVMSIGDMTVDALNDVTFDTPVDITAGKFHIAYEITYTTPLADTFGVYQQQPNAANTYLINYPSVGWIDMSAATGGSYPCALAIGARVNMTFTDPLAEVSPSSWAAGGVEVGSDLVSGTFTLTNGGAGTLTVSDVSGIAAPFTTTFVQGDVSLAADETYDFTFTFAPTAEGAAAATMQITTNGGVINIDLTGTGNTPVTGDMDGGFENNVNDFDLVFTGWTQHDEDGATATYGIENVTFANSAYEGSYMAFNPASTSPAMAAEWATFDGNRYGVAFAAIPAQGGPNNDWLVTPQTAVLNEGASFQAQVQSITDQYGLERYAIWVSTTDDQVGSFTKISAGEYVEAATAGWEAINYDLSAYAGGQIYVAIQCVSNDVFAFMIDAIVIDNPVSVATDVTAAISVFPNPANNVITVVNAENANIAIINMVGAVVSTVENAAANQTIDISELANGTYFVRVDSEVFKINVAK